MNKVKIYTKTGDSGQTSLYGGKRVLKSDVQVEAYGSVDELNSSLGVLISHLEKTNPYSSFFISIQSDLFTIGSVLAGNTLDMKGVVNRVSEMENLIDTLEKELPPLNHFILPQGSPVCTFAHLARAVCRRSERAVVWLFQNNKESDRRIVMYLNRLSDLLFVYARLCNKIDGIDEIVWKE
jgi:cob(I)alamin adenosyltransferase